MLFKALTPILPLEYLRFVVFKRVHDLASLKQILPWRKVGFSMIWSLIMGKGEEILRLEPQIMKIVHAMCEDNNWHIRKWNAQYLA